MSGGATHPGPDYSERLWVPAWWWLLAAFLLWTLWLAYARFLGAVAALAVAAAATLVVGGALLSYGSALVRVDRDGLVAGQARLPLTAIGAVSALDGPAARALRGPQADPRAYLLLRGYLAAVVRVEVEDPADATPYWLVSTRHPERLRDALDAAVSPH